MARTKFQKELVKRQNDNEKMARRLLSKLEKLPDHKRQRIWEIGVDASELYRNLCRQSQFQRMQVTDRELTRLESILKEVKDGVSA